LVQKGNFSSVIITDSHFDDCEVPANHIKFINNTWDNSFSSLPSQFLPQVPLLHY
jgi:hypothetical protein